MKADAISKTGCIPDASILFGDSSASASHAATFGHRRLRVTQRDDLLVLGFRDAQLHAEAAAETGEEFNAAVAQAGVTKFVLDFSGVGFACSDVINKIVILNRRAREKAGRLVLCGICSSIREIFTVTKLDSILDIAETETDALLRFV